MAITLTVATLQTELGDRFRNRYKTAWPWRLPWLNGMRRMLRIQFSNEAAIRCCRMACRTTARGDQIGINRWH